MKGISVIIPTLNRTDFLIPTLHDILRQQVNQPYEIIVVDQTQDKDQQVITLADRHPLLHYYHIDFFRGLPEARNYGAQKAQYDVLVYIDDDIECQPDFLQRHWNTFLELPDVAVVAGGITEKFKSNPDGKIGQFVSKTATPLRSFHKEGFLEVDHAGGGNFSIRKEFFFKVSGMDENLTKGAALYEETDLCLRVKEAGGKIWFNSAAHVFHLAADTGGCRVADIDKYVYNLVRNRSLIIMRHLKGLDKVTARAELFRLVLAYTISYKKLALIKSFFTARKEGEQTGMEPIRMTVYER